MVRNLFLTVVAVLLISSVALAQTGKISGKVMDRETGDALPGANVVLVGTTLGAATDVSGEFVILSVPTGVYTIKAAFIGYRAVEVVNTRVSSGLTTQLDFELPSEALEVSEISIIAERPLVNRNATNAVRIQSYEDFKNLPIRGVGAAVALQPGIVTVNDQIYIRGGRTNDTGYFLEGANVRDRMGEELPASGGDNPVQVIPEALEEFQIQAGGYTAEFGGANAGIIRQTLKSGGPEYHGTIQFETDDFASQGDQFLSTHSYGYKDVVATLGGPVPGFGRKLRFFVAGERKIVDDRIRRFSNGFNFQHSDVPDFENNRFPLILTRQRDEELEALIQSSGIVMQDGNIPGADQQEWIGNGTLTYDANPFIFRLSYSGSVVEQDATFRNIPQQLFNLDRIGETTISSSLFNLKATHLVGPKSFYEVNVSFLDRREYRRDNIFGNDYWAYWDSTRNIDDAGIQFSGLVNPWIGGTAAMDIYGFNFDAPGTPSFGLTKQKRGYWGGTFNWTTQLPQHEVKLGASYESWTIRNYQMSAGDARRILVGARANPDVYREAVAGDLSAQRQLAVSAILREQYGYDVFGNECDDCGGSSVDAPRHPKYFSAYFQDKFEASDIVINAGVRLDVINNDDFEFADPKNPPKDRANRGLAEADLVNVDANIEISPRLGVAFPVTDRTVFHMQYGRFVQAPRLTDIYQGSTWYDAVFTGGTSFQTNAFGLGLDPEITTQYDVGFNQQFTDNAAFDVTVFYKSIKDQIRLDRVQTDPDAQVSDYNILVNGDFATTAGMEVSLTLRRTARLAGQFNYTFSRALGTGSTPAAAIAAIELLQPIPTVISPLDFHRSHVGSFNLDYRWGRGDGGSLLQELGLNLLLTFRSGHPYTLVEGGLGQQDAYYGGTVSDPRSRELLESVNASTTPWNFSVDFRLDKSVDFGKFGANFYVYVQNLLNRKNVINVYNRTGNAFNDGFLTNPALSASVLAAQDNLAIANGLAPGVGAAAYEALYRAINLNGNNWALRDGGGQNADGTFAFEALGTPRQIRAGASLSF